MPEFVIDFSVKTQDFEKKKKVKLIFAKSSGPSDNFCFFFSAIMNLFADAFMEDWYS